MMFGIYIQEKGEVLKTINFYQYMNTWFIGLSTLQCESKSIKTKVCYSFKNEALNMLSLKFLHNVY